jgi:hypothetical protein
MALLDQNLAFQSTPQAITATARSTLAYDLLNGNSLASTGGLYSSNAIIGNATVFGEDLGFGRGKGTPTVEVFSGAGTPITATSLQISFDGAPDAGTGSTTGLTWVPYIQTGAIPIASILASNRLAVFDWPSRRVKAALPRFVSLNYIVGGANFAGLTVTSYINLGGTTAQDTLGQYASNY